MPSINKIIWEIVIYTSPNFFKFLKISFISYRLENYQVDKIISFPKSNNTPKIVYRFPITFFRYNYCVNDIVCLEINIHVQYY